MEISYPERSRSDGENEIERKLAAAEAIGIQLLGIRRLPAAGEEMAVNGEMWQVGDVANITDSLEDRLPDNIHEKLTQMKSIGLSVDHLVSGYYIGRYDDGADLYRTFEPSYFGFLRARPMLNVGLMYGLGGAEHSADE